MPPFVFNSISQARERERALFDQCNNNYWKICILLLTHKQIQIQLADFAAKRIHYTAINKFE
jgi:hypothetical protein